MIRNDALMRHLKVTLHALIERLLEDCSQIPVESLSS
jgi:hypothetical protein